MKNLYNNKMKNFTKFFAIALLSAITFSCVEDDDFAVPETAPVNIDAPDNLQPLAFVIDQIDQSFDGIVTFDTEDVFVEGYVISSDQAGNYFEELIIQDAVESPQAGIKVLIDVNPLFTRYQVGQRVFIRLDGLTAAIGNGVPTLGFLGSDNTLQKIAPALQDEYVLRDDDVFDIVPTLVSSSSDLTRAKSALLGY